ncbi:Fc.00g035990.m01.CDS01 [Cosmosporella sp. VM-42]
MNDIVVHTNTPVTVLPYQPYASENEWYNALCVMHMAQLEFQQHDAVEDGEDARDKYVARQLFRNLANERRLPPELSISGKEFILFPEDFGPVNVLLDKDLQVVSVID